MRVRGPDGIIIEFPEGTPNETINQVMSQRQQEMEARQRAGNQQMGAQQPRNRPRSSNPTGRRPGANTLSAPNRQFLDARAARAQQRAPQGAPGTMLRALEDFNRSGPTAVMDQMWRNMGVADELSGWSAQLQSGGIPGTQRGEAAYDAASALERDERRRVAQEQPGVNTASIVASIPAFGGTPTNVGRVGMLEAGAGAAGINLPFALGRQEGSFMERLPGAALETAIVGGAGAALQGAANRFLAPPAANSTAQRAQEFERAGVRAPLAAVQGRQGASMAMAIAENPIGGNVRRHLQNSVDDVQAAHQRLVAQSGTPEPRDVAGEIVQRGVRRFANGHGEPMPVQQRLNTTTGRMERAPAQQIPTRDWSVGAKANALYDDVFARLAADEQAMVAGGIRGILTADATQSAIRSIQQRVSGAASREVMASPMVAQIERALAEDIANGTLRFQDLRAWRTWVREAQRNEGLRQGLDNAALQRLEAALTQDIYASALNIGGQAARDLRLVDRWYRTAMDRIKTALQPFDDAPGGAQAFRRVIDLASQGGRQNIRQLRQLRQSLRPSEWRSVAATVMDELGAPTPGAANAMEQGAFSIERFVTNVARLSPEGREALFGPQLARELENLARVAGYIKRGRGFANHSHSASSIQNVSTIGGVATAGAAAATGNAAPLGMLIAAGVAARITGEMLTNPAFVRWLTSPGSGGLKRQMAALATIASRDPAVAPLYTELARSVGDRSPAPTDPQSAYIQPLP